MGKLKSFLKVEGTIGEVTFVKRNGKIIAREKGGVNGDTVKNDPRFQRTRENMSEFGNSTSASGLVRHALSFMLGNAKDGLVHQRLTSIMAKIKNLDLVGVRGGRTVAQGILNPVAIGLLKGFEFNAQSPLSGVLNAPYSLDTATGQIDIPSIVPMADLQYPGGATHVKFQGAWSKLDFASGQYITQASNEVVLPINNTPTSVSLSIPTAPAMAGAKDAYLLKVEFGQEINGVYYSLKNGQFNCLSLIDFV